MDTNVKKFKYSFWGKLICVLLCIITFIGAAGITTLGAMSIGYFNDYDTQPNAECEWDETGEFRSYLAIDTGRIRDTITRSEYLAEQYAKAERAKGRIVQNVFDGYMSNMAGEKNSYTNEWGYSSFEEFLDNTGETYQYYEFPEAETSFSGEIPYSLFKEGEEAVKGEIEKRYDEYLDGFLENADNGYYSGEWYSISNSNFKYYVEYNGDIYSNVYNNKKEFDEKYFQSREYHYTYRDKQVTSKGFNKKAEKLISDSLLNEYNVKDSADIYICLDLAEKSDTAQIIHDFLYNNSPQTYSQLYNIHPTMQKIYTNFAGYAVLDLILIVLSFVFAFYCFSIAGKKDENEPAKLAFIDYLPVELHIAAALGLGFLAFWFAGGVVQGSYTKVFAFIVIVVAVICQLLLLELISSITRLVKSDKKFYKFCLTYYILRALLFILKKIIKVIKKIFGLIGRLFKKIKSSAKSTIKLFSYKPGQLNKNAIFFGVLFVFCNLIAILFTVLLFASQWVISAFLFVIAIIAADAVIIKKFLTYIKQLDEVISASVKHEDVANIDSLPQSLKTLAESMKYTNAELSQAVARAVKDERMKTELITNVSHDLKTPLTSIITYVDLLSKCDIKDEKALEYIDVLDKKGAKLKRLIDDLIEASKVNSGNITFNPVNLNLSELCLQSTIEAQNDFEKAGLELIIKQGDSKDVIFADGPKTYRIIQNLLSNARKYSAKGTRVYTSVYSQGGFGVFEIKNISAQPLDISPEELTERFVRGDKSRNQEGNGLGLSIAKELCRAQGGELEIAIDGDMFKAKVKLPLAK